MVSASPWNLRQTYFLLRIQRLRNTVVRTSDKTSHDTYKPATCRRLCKLRKCIISLQNYSDSKRKSYRFVGMKIFVLFERTKPITEKIVVLKLAAVKFAAVSDRLLLSEYV